MVGGFYTVYKKELKNEVSMSNRIEVKTSTKEMYEIVLENSFNSLQDELKKINLINKKACIISDDMVSPIYGEMITKLLKEINVDVFAYTIKHGEENKNLKTVEGIYEFLIKNHINRNDYLVALGGGVVGDITGFTAATYLRGIDFVQIPTTLLAQVDSSIGGKTGVDFLAYKNMVGAFYMPKLVYTNLSTLSTLNERQFYSGFAEAMKSAIIKNATYYEWLIEHMYEITDKEMDTLEELVFQSCNIKKAIVEKDPYETGDRALLNLGHTIGHAIEKAKGFSLLHGECVALGCIGAAYISWKKELLSMDEYYEIRDMFVPFNLPISVEAIEPEEILQLTKSDKKADNQGIKFVLIKKIGKAIIDRTVTDEEIINAVKELIYTDEME